MKYLLPHTTNYKKYFCCLIVMSTFLTACHSETTEAPPSTTTNTLPIKDTQLMMGTSISISIYDQENPAILDEAFELISTLEHTLSLNQEHTLLDTVNQNAGIEPTVVTDDMFDVVSRGLYYSELTDGSFDITIGPLVKLWDIGFPEARVPDTSELEAILPLVDFDKLHLDETNKTIYMETPGMRLDLGSIAKGYAADRVVELLDAAGVHHALIDLGGNLFVHGTKVDGSQWRVGVQDPFNPRGEIIGILEASNQSIVTSGIYERYLEVEDTKYHHILNPQTGYPFENEIAGVTIVSGTSIDGDALSTSVFSKGIQEGLSFVEQLDGIEAIFISKDREVYTTSGIKDSFRLNNDSFTIVN